MERCAILNKCERGFEMLNHKNNFLQLCLQIESLNNQKQNSSRHDEKKACDNKIKELKISIDKVLDNYLETIKQESIKC